MAEERQKDRPFEGGAQPVREHPPEVPSAGRTVSQTIVIAVVILVVLAGILWVVVPFGG